MVSSAIIKVLDGSKRDRKIKCFTLLIVLSLFFGTRSNAQFQAGIKAAYMVDTINNIDMELESIDNNLNVYVARKGFQMGVFAAYRLGRFSLRPEVLLTTIDQDFRPPYILVRVNNIITNFKSTQWEVPLLLGYHLSEQLQIFVAPKWVFGKSNTYQSYAIAPLNTPAELNSDIGFAIQLGAVGLDVRYTLDTDPSGAYYLDTPLEAKSQFISSKGKYLQVGLSVFIF